MHGRSLGFISTFLVRFSSFISLILFFLFPFFFLKRTCTWCQKVDGSKGVQVFGVAAKGASQGCVCPTYFRPMILNSHYIMYGFQKSTHALSPPRSSLHRTLCTSPRQVRRSNPGQRHPGWVSRHQTVVQLGAELGLSASAVGMASKTQCFFFFRKHYCIYRFHQQLLASHVINGRLRSISTTPSLSNRPGIPADVYVHRGFLSSYSDIRSEMLDYIGQAISACSWCDITVVGHSLGAAQAALFVADIKNNATMQRNVR